MVVGKDSMFEKVNVKNVERLIVFRHCVLMSGCFIMAESLILCHVVA